MTSWRSSSYLPFLLVLLTFIDLSKGGCDDYFDPNSWKNNLTDVIPLIKTKNPEDVVECSVERHSINNPYMRPFFYHCFNRTDVSISVSEKCEGDESGVKVYFYHFLCMIARAIKNNPKGCEGFDNVCPSFPGASPIAYDQTTPATLPETTRAAAPTTAATTNPDGTFRGQSAHSSSAEASFTAPLAVLLSVIGVLLCLCFVMLRQCLQAQKELNALRKMVSSDLEKPGGDEASQANAAPCDAEVRGNGGELAILLRSTAPSTPPTPGASEGSKKNRGVH